MGAKDIVEKHLEEYDDVFADIVNVLLFNGEERIKQNSLETDAVRSQYKADATHQIHEQERDVAKFWKDGNIRIALVGFENQTVSDKDMVFRVIGYDGQSYRSQVSSGKDAKTERFPVITLVLHFGMSRWNKSKTIHDALQLPDYLKPYVSDYTINVFDIAFLTPEQVQMFKSDFRIVADYNVVVYETRIPRL